MSVHQAITGAGEVAGIAFPATPANNRILLDVMLDARLDTQADRLGVDRAQYRLGNLVHTDPRNRRHDFYIDDTAQDRAIRMWTDDSHLPISPASPLAPPGADGQRAPIEAPGAQEIVA